MEGQDPTNIAASEPISANAESPEHGLRILARIIARRYRRDAQAGAEAEAKPIGTSSGSSTPANKRRPRKPPAQLVEEDNDV